MTDFTGVRIVTDPRMPDGVALLRSPGHQAWFITGLAPERKPPVTATTLPPIVLPFDADLGPVRDHVRALAQGLAAFADSLAPELDTEAAKTAGYAAVAPEDDGLTTFTLYIRRPMEVGAGRYEEIRATSYGAAEGWVHFNRYMDRVASYRDDTVESIRACP